MVNKTGFRLLYAEIAFLKQLGVTTWMQTKGGNLVSHMNL